MNKVRKKIVIYAELSVFILLTVLLTIVNVINFSMVSDDADRITQRIAAESGAFASDQTEGKGSDSDKPSRKPDDTKADTDAGRGRFGQMGPESPETQASMRYFTYAFDKEKNATQIVYKITSISEDEAEELRHRGGDGGEYGATTGRPRRVGWYDCVASKYGCALQGATDVALTVLDVLGYLDEIPVCIGYKVDGKVTDEFPTTRTLERCEPVYETLPGWKCDITGIRKYEELPENCRKYIEFIEKHIGFPITMVSNGPSREDIIYRK